jgi:hypothetical protein
MSANRCRIRVQPAIVVLAVVAAACSQSSTGPGGQAGESVVLAVAANVATCTNDRDEATASLLDDLSGFVAAVGDNVQPTGSLANFTDCYDPTWGRHLDRTFAVPGNHEYDVANAAGFFDYFGERGGPRGLGYYSADIGAWHVIVLNDNLDFVPIDAGSAQDQWLVDDLAANTKQCVLAMWHQPRFLSSNDAGFTVRPTRKNLWDRLYAAGVEIVLNGHQHHYERMAPMNPDGNVDDAAGIRQFNVGTGGESTALPTVTIHPNSDVVSDAFGVLKLTLRPDGYDWEFLPIAGESFTERGTSTCH